MMERLVAVAMAGLLLSGGIAQAQSSLKPADQADLECMAVAAYFGASTEDGSQEQAGLVGGMMYYLGKLRGRSPDVDWLSKLGELVQTMEPSDIEALSQRCGADLVEVGSELVTWGNRMSGAIKGK